MKIAFYIPNRGIYQKDLSNINEGNPGIGGSEFSAVLIATNLSGKKGLEILLLCDRKGIFPNGLQTQPCGCLEKAMEFAEKKQFDYVIVDAKLLKEHILTRFYKLHFIAWANCFIEEKERNLIAKSPNIIQIINVGAQQNKLLEDSNINKKSTYIYNAVPTSILKYLKQDIIPIDKRDHNVIYIGSIHKAKGFHCLAKAWPYILQKVPDAQLYIVGSGKLYNRAGKLGKWGIATKEYEDEFMKYLIKDNQILPSVHFMGIMGLEKYELLNKCKVGVPNPWGKSETFGYTAVEMEIMGCHVTTIKCPGYLDTVYDKTNLYDNIDSLGDYVVRLLNTNKINYNETMDFISQFSIQTITEKWYQLLTNLPNHSSYHITHFKLIQYFKAFIKCKYLELKSKIKYWVKK